MTSHPFLEFQKENGEQSDFPGPQVSRLAARIRAGPPKKFSKSFLARHGIVQLLTKLKPNLHEFASRPTSGVMHGLS